MQLLVQYVVFAVIVCLLRITGEQEDEAHCIYYFCADLWVNVFFEHREPGRRHGSVSSMTTFISQNIIQTDSTSVGHRRINAEGKDH